MADGAWSWSTCKPLVQWYGVPGSGCWYATARYGQYWVGGGVWQTYAARNFECGDLGPPVKAYGWISEFGGGAGMWFENGCIIYRLGRWTVFVGNYGQTAGRLANDARPEDAELPPEHDEIVAWTAKVGPDPDPEMLAAMSDQKEETCP